MSGNKQKSDCAVVAAVNVTGVPYSRLVKDYKLSQESIERIQEGHEAIVQRLVSDKARRLLNALSPDVL